MLLEVLLTNRQQPLCRVRYGVIWAIVERAVVNQELHVAQKQASLLVKLLVDSFANGLQVERILDHIVVVGHFFRVDREQKRLRLLHFSQLVEQALEQRG